MFVPAARARRERLSAATAEAQADPVGAAWVAPLAALPVSVGRATPAGVLAG